MCLNKSKLIYILIPLFLITTTSCEQKPKEEPSAVKQEVVVIKISTPPPAALDSQSLSKADNQTVSSLDNQAVPDELNTNNKDSLLNSQNNVETQSITKTDIAKTDLNSKEENDNLTTTDNSSNMLQSNNQSDITADNKVNQPVNPNEVKSSKTSSENNTILNNNSGIEQNNDKDIVHKTEQPEQAEDKNIVDQKTLLSDTKKILPDTASSSDGQSKPFEQSPNKENFDKKELIIPESAIKLDIEEEKLFYIAKGKIDPFDPLIREKAPVEEIKETLEENIPERILTPLEKLDFSQMKLVAILNRESGSVAMVQEATGKGYIVNIGTYIGRNSGQVISIETNKIVIQEKTKDYKGNVVDRFQELKLNKLD